MPKKEHNISELINLNFNKDSDKKKINDFISDLEKDKELEKELSFEKLEIKNNIQFENRLNFLDKSNRLLSFFAYLPDLDANGQPLLLRQVVLTNLDIPKLDAQGNFIYLTNPNNGLLVKEFQKVDAFPIPPIATLADPSTSLPMRQEGKHSSNLNPTRFYDLKNQVRVQADRKPNPIVEYAFVKVQDYKKAELDKDGNIVIPEVKSITVIIQIKWDAFNKKIVVSPDNYGKFQGQLQSSDYDWRVSSLPAAKTANILEQITQMEDSAKRDDILEQIAKFANLKAEQNSK
jgi:hypothetical protein